MFVLFIALLNFVGNSKEDLPELTCLKSFGPNHSEIVSVHSEAPLTWLEMQELCWTEHPGNRISSQYKDFSPEVEAMCPIGSLVPIAIAKVNGELWWKIIGDEHRLTAENSVNLTVSDLNVAGTWGALRWPTTELVIVGNETKFTCAICNMYLRADALFKGAYPPHNNSIYAYDLELVSYDQVDEIGLVANGSDLANKLLGDLAEAFNVSVKALRWHGATLNGDHKAVVHVYYDRGDVFMNWTDYVHWNDPDLERKTVDNFELTSIKLNTECLTNKPARHKSVRDKAILTGSINSTFNLQQMTVVMISECYWDPSPGVESAVWSPTLAWTLIWVMCDQRTIGMQLLSLRGAEFSMALRSFDIQMVFFLSEKNRAPFLEFIHDLKKFGYLINLILKAHCEGDGGTAFALLSNSILLNLGRVYMLLSFEEGTTSILVHTNFFYLLAADQNVKNPVVGLALSLGDGNSDTRKPVTQLNHADLPSKQTGSQVVVTVSDSIAFSAKRLAIATYAAHLDYPNRTSYDDSVDSWMAIVQVTFTRSEMPTDGVKNDFIDIAFKPVFRMPTQRGKCAERLFASDEWFDDNCRILRSVRDGLLVCRCQNLYNDGEFTSSTYLIYGFDASLSTYLASNRNLIIVIIVVSVLSGVGLLSVVATAIFFPDWRKDQGHQLLLQMILALTVNLALGFVNNFISIDTKSIACIGIGVVRHYSFLAMFFWMMILSGLQIKRLTTISGAKSTTHLILKVSLIAWGLPLLPIILLLSWNTSFYKSEVSIRGYCYPEGIAFQATVQGPAGIILIANLVIFVIILNHIYGWVKCNSDVVVRKHTANDRATQLRNFANSIFVFFLFGFTWVFHFLSEEGIINSEFLFEFLFLITASFHLFMLSFFFIVLDKKTRTLWLVAFGGQCRQLGERP